MDTNKLGQTFRFLPMYTSGKRWYSSNNAVIGIFTFVG